MGVSRVDYADETLIDLTSDTVDADNLALGVTAHSADGEPIVGIAPKTWTGTRAEYNAQQSQIANGTIVNITDDYSSGGASTAEEVSFDNTTTQMSADNVQDAIDEVFQSVSNGKGLIADAITDRGIETSASDTFSTMANNISQVGLNIYDKGYVVDSSLILWVDGEFNDCNPTEHNNTKRLWCPRYFGGDLAFPIGEIYDTPVWGDNYIEFVARSKQSAVRFNRTYPWSGKAGITCECLVEYTNHSSGNNECFSQTESGGWYLGCTSGIAKFNLRLSGSSSNYYINSPSSLELNRKYLLCGTYDVESGIQKFYIDGVLVGSEQLTSGTAIMNPDTNIWIGTDGMGANPESNYNTYAMVGKVYSARLYDRALTAQEIMNNYTIDSQRYS